MALAAEGLMLFSYTIPCHKRFDDLRRALPTVVDAADASGWPVEIVVVLYGRQPEVSRALGEEVVFDPRYLNVRVVSAAKDRDYYHMAHARNVGIKASVGAFVIISSADILPRQSYFTHIQHRLQETGADWLEPDPRLMGVIVCDRQKLIDLGGFDERFEFYGPEDRDLKRRLGSAYRGNWYSSRYLDAIPTPDDVKVQHYRLPLSKKEMSRQGRAIYRDNIDHNRLVVNEGVEWGKP